ncbi:Putative two-component sensor histidine kinase [hydrothermal vent metagenome]|uniref:Putative two-component sensor histidine kinase n=1 Tax=hydrothermal vent metagenome TaxID=652676 RepID=A0A1W1BLE0_9ZZZZ
MLFRHLFIGFLFLWSSLDASILNVGIEDFYKTKGFISYTLANDLNETPYSLDGRIWTKSKDSFNTFENADKAYWAKIKFKNLSTSSKTYYIQSENQFTYSIEFYLMKNGKIVDYIQDGVIHKNRKRAFNTNHMTFPITLLAHEEATVFFKIRNYNKIDIDFFLRSKEYLLDFYQSYNIIEGVFFGGMFIMMLYNLFLYFLLKYPAYLYYVFYTFWLIIYFIGLFGFSQRYFPDYKWIFYLSSGMFFIFMTLFIQSILHIKEKLPRVYILFKVFLVYFVIFTLLNSIAIEVHSFFYAQILFDLFFILVPIYVILVISTTYYLAYSQNDIVARFYSVIWTIVSMVGLLLPLNYLNLFKMDIHSDYIFQFLILFEVLCFSFILAYKIKLIQQEKRNQSCLLIKQNKLASMGEMISIIAHQWRQPLSEINGIVLEIDMDNRKKRLDDNSLDRYLNEIEASTAYLSGTISDFMNFFKHDKNINYFYISDAINRANKLLSLSHRKNSVKIIVDIEENIELYSYQSELIQALLILMNNSIDAFVINNINNPKIIIKTRRENKNIIITIEDNAGGIPLGIIDKIYNPYFTTKHESKGTGLGLYILAMLIEKSMQGFVDICNINEGVISTLSIPVNISK